MTLKALIPILAAAAVCFALDLKVFEPKQITTDPSKESDIVIKDETAIYFASDRSGNFDIYKKDLIKETVTRLTFQPSNEYPKYFEKKILMESDETDAHGNLYFLTESGDQELLLGLVGKEKNPFIKDGKVYFSEDYRGKTSFKYFEPGSKRKPKQIKSGIGAKALFSGPDEILYISEGDEKGYNNLYTEKTPGDSIAEPVQITFGQKIITAFDISSDGNAIVYSAVTTDTDQDQKTDLFDNSILYRIIRSGGYFSDPVQLTPESYSSSDPKMSQSGQIFYISDRKGSGDVWSCGMNGVAPLMPTGNEQTEISGQILEKYKAEVLLSEALDEKISEKTLELLSMALISYNRCLTFNDIPDEAKAPVYFRIAEIYEIQGNYSRAESVFRIIQSRYGTVEELSAQAELGRSKAELKRKGIGTKELGYELDEHIRYLTGLSDRYSSVSAKNQIFLRIGEIYQDLGRHTEANGYFLRAIQSQDGAINPESYFRQAKSSFADGNYNAGAELLNTAINSALTGELKEKYIREYFVFPGLDRASVSERISGAITNEALPVELRSYANYVMAGITEDAGSAVFYFGECRKYYVSNPNNILLKKFSAEADLALGRSYIGSKQTEAAEGVLKYMIANYKDISYGVFSSVAMKMLSAIYLENAAVYNDRKMYDNALLVYTKAFELDGTGIEAIRGIADSYFRLNRIDEAARYFTPFYESNRNSAFLNYALGYTYSIRGASPGRKSLDDVLLAIRLINRTLELDSGIKYAYLTLSYCHEAAYQIKLTQAETEKDRNIVLKGLDFVTGPLKYVLETVNLIEDTDIDHTDAAISVLNRGLSLTDPDTDGELYLKLRLNLANNYYNMGEYARKQALDHYLAVLGADHAFSSKKQEAVIYERTGHCLFTTGDDRAEEYYDKAARLYRELNDRQGELRVSMRTALMYLTKEDDEGDLIAGDDAFQKYSDILIKLKSEDNKEAISLILRNSAFSKFIDSEYDYSAGILQNILDADTEYKDDNKTDNFIILSLLGLDIPVWKLDLVLGSQFAEGFEGKDELALLYAIKASSYSKLKDYGPVRKMLAEKAEIFKQKDNKLALSIIENRLGIVDYFTGNFEHSIKKFENSEKMCIELGLFNSALENRNNILKAAVKCYGKDKTDQIRQLTADTVVTALSFPTAGIFEKVVNRNLKGVLHYKLFTNGKDGSPAEKYASFRDLLNAEKLFFEADTLLSSSPGTNEEKNRLSASILYNLATVQFQSGKHEDAKSTLGRAKELSELTYDKLLHWRIELRSGDLENSPELKLDHYIRSEELLSEYLPPTGDYELISGWKDDIRPLYDRLITAHLEKNDLFRALNYAERFKNRTLLNYYSSRHLEFKEQLHNIHVKKIRYNNDEIARYRQRAELMRSKNAEKYAKQISEYEERADFYEKELNDIYDQIEKSGDERLLQFVSIEDMNSEDVSELLGEDMALISIYSLPDEELYFYYDGVEVKISRSKAGGYEKIFDGFESEVVGKEHVFIVPDFNESVNADFVKIFHQKGFFNRTVSGIPVSKLTPEALSSEQNREDVQFVPYAEIPKNNIISVLPSVSSLKMVSGNENINYSELKVCSGADVKEEDIAAYFENGGIIYFDKPVKVNPSNSLEDLFYLGNNELKMSDLLKMKMPAYAVVINGFDGTIRPEDKMILANTLIFSGVQSVIIQEKSDGQTDLSGKIFKNAAEYDLTTILKSSRATYTLIGMKGMDKQEQTDFATSNLKNSLLDGARYFGRKVYEKAAVYFIQALAMARNTGDVQEYNILKTLISCLVNIKDYKRAIIYTHQFIDYTEKKGTDSQRLSAYDDLSRNYILNKQYDEAALWQNRILQDKKGNLNVKVSAYNMLSIIYSYKGDLKESIRYKKEYLKNSQLLSSNEISSIRQDLNEKSSEILFNSLRNILVSYYKQGETDSALFVYDTILKNIEVFEDVDGSSFGELTESAGLCYFKKSQYSKAEELYKEAMEYFTDDAKRSSVHLNLADMYYYSDKLSDALKHLAEAEKAALSPAALIRLYTTRSLIEIKSDDLPAARTYSYKALEKTIETSDRSEESTARVNLAKILILTGDIEGAKRNLTNSSRLAGETGNTRALISAKFYSGEIFLDHENSPDSALSAYRSCLDLSIKGGDEYFRSRAYLGIGSAYIAKNSEDSSGVYLKKSLDHALRFGFNDVYFASSLKLSGVYSKASPERSLEVLNAASGVSVKMAIGSSNRLSYEFESLIFEIFETKILLLLRSGMIKEAVSTAVVRDRLFAENDRKYFGIISTSNITGPENAYESVKSYLEKEKETAVLLFFGAGNSVGTAVLSAGNGAAFSTSMTKEIQALPAMIESRGDVSDISKKAYSSLFPAGLTQALSGMKNIIIYSSGTMKNYPFDALFDGKEYLIDKYDISESNSPEGLNTEIITGQLGKSMSLVNPFTAESELVFSEREFSALEFLTGKASRLTGRQATETAVRSSDAKKYDLIHLPVHSFSVSKDSLRTGGRSSYIQLSADEKNDGRLEWDEILALDMDGKEVILSGCDTGGKTGTDYYRHFDLSRAFSEAGAGTIISGRWKTDDLAASVLMKRYFRHTSSGLDRASALSLAKREVKHYFSPHPYHWANFKISL